LALLSCVARKQIREPSVISISSDSEIEVEKRPSKASKKPAVKQRAVTVKKQRVPVTVDSDENSDDRRFIDDSAVVDDESAERSYNVVIHYELSN